MTESKLLSQVKQLAPDSVDPNGTKPTATASNARLIDGGGAAAVRQVPSRAPAVGPRKRRSAGAKYVLIKA